MQDEPWSRSKINMATIKRMGSASGERPNLEKLLSRLMEWIVIVVVHSGGGAMDQKVYSCGRLYLLVRQYDLFIKAYVLLAFFFGSVCDRCKPIDPLFSHQKCLPIVPQSPTAPLLLLQSATQGYICLIRKGSARNATVEISQGDDGVHVCVVR